MRALFTVRRKLRIPPALMPMASAHTEVRFTVTTITEAEGLSLRRFPLSGAVTLSLPAWDVGMNSGR
jgi:hypothetical protein